MTSAAVFAAGVTGGAEAQQVVNPTVLAPAARPPQARAVTSVVSRGHKGLKAPREADKKFVVARRVSIDGAFPELAEANATFATKVQGRRLSLAELYRYAGELQAAYAKAYPLATLSAPKPDFPDGDVRLDVTDGVIEKIELVGVSEQTQELVRARLASLVGKRHLTAEEYQRHILLIGALGGVSGQLATAPSQADDAYVLTGVLVENRIAGSSVVTNCLPMELGTWEFANAFAVNNALGLGEQVSGSASSSTDFDRYFSGKAKSQAYTADVGLPLGVEGLTVAAGYLSARWHPSPYDSALNADFIDMGERFNGLFDRVYAHASYPLILTSALTLRAQAFVEHIDNRYSYTPFPVGFSRLGAPIFDTAQDRYSAVRLVAEGNYQLPFIDNARVSGLVAYGRGLGGREESLDYVFGPPLSKIGASPLFDRLNAKARLDLGLPEQFVFSAIGRMRRLQSSGSAGASSWVRAGWTIGAGLEWMFAPNASLDAEYPHYDLGSATYGLSPLTTVVIDLRNLSAMTAQTQLRGDLARLGLNYHFGQSVHAGETETPAAFASGFYAGLNAGYGWDATPSVVSSGNLVLGALDQGAAELLGNTQPPTLGPVSAAVATGVSLAAANGAFGGGQGGYNCVMDRYLAGVEADMQGAAFSGRGGFTAAAPFLAGADTPGSTGVSTSIEKTIDWFGALRARAGYLFTPSILAYATGGLAYGGVTLDNRVAHLTDGFPYFQSIGGIGHISRARGGWTAGGGVERKFTPTMSLNAEYLYVDLGQAQTASGVSDNLYVTTTDGPRFYANVAAISAKTRFGAQTARVGLNYSFDPAALLPMLR